MSTPILPFAVWAPGTNQNSIPANDNSLRNQILNGLVISDSTDAQPGSPANGDIYIMTGAATGDQWSTFDEFDLVIFTSSTWYAFAPVEGIVVNLAGALMRWDGAAYVSASGGGGSSYSETTTISGTSHSLVMADAGKYLRFTNSSAKTLTVQDEVDEPVTQDAEFNGRNANTGDLTIVEDTAVTVNPPAGGTLVIPESGTFTLKRVAEDEWDLIGVTVAA